MTRVTISNAVTTSISVAGGFSTRVSLGGVINTGGGGAPDVPAIAFAHGDSTPKPLLLIAAGQRVFEVVLSIEVPFNGIGAALSIGTLGNPNLLAPASEIDPSVEAVFEFAPGELFVADTNVYLFITPGSGASAGAGSVFLEPQ